MKNISSLKMITILFLFLSFSVHAIDIPASKKAISVHFRIHDGWWISIHKDGSGAYGFGTSIDKIRVKKGTFLFSNILDSIEQIFILKPKQGELEYMAVSFYKKGESGAIEYPIAVNNELLANLFKLAQMNIIPPSHEFDIHRYYRVKRHWLEYPPIFVSTKDKN